MTEILLFILLIPIYLISRIIYYLSKQKDLHIEYTIGKYHLYYNHEFIEREKSLGIDGKVRTRAGILII